MIANGRILALMVVRASILVLALGVVAGCSCSSTPIQPSCHATSECGAGLLCIDGRCTAGTDAAMDAHASDAAPASDSPIVLADSPVVDANCIPVTCGATEVCFDGIDDDCDGMVDEMCSCVPGTTARCLPGRPDPSTPRCSWGQMTCSGASEFGSWGACMGGGAIDGGSSLYGCRRIGIMGAPGADPSANFQAWLQTQGAIVTRFHTTAAAPTLHIEELRTYDLVVIDWLQRDYTMAEADTLTQWVNEGGGLFAMTGHDSGATADRQVSLLASLGPNYDIAFGPLNGPAMLLPNPTTLAADGMTTLPPITFNGGLRVTIPASIASTFVPMAMIGTNVVGAAGPIGMGHALLFGDEWIEFDSEWSTMPSIPQFWKDSVEWLSPDPMIAMACPDQ